MLRQTVLVLVLIGAAFAGGAAINGPGLAWLQRNLIGGPTIVVDGSIPPGDPGRAGKRFPSANPPPLPFVFASVPSGTIPRPANPTPVSLPSPTLSPGTSSRQGAELLGLADSPPPELAATARPAPNAPTVEPVNSAAPPPLELPTGPALPPLASVPPPDTKADPVARLASTAEPDPTPSTTPGHDWAEVRQRLRTLGVSRYTIDAELDGRVRFSCVIPVDGLRAVGHHFEADGDDEYQAIDATIRRITLWHATEPMRTEP